MVCRESLQRVAGAFPNSPHAPDSPFETALRQFPMRAKVARRLRGYSMTPKSPRLRIIKRAWNLTPWNKRSALARWMETEIASQKAAA